MAPAHGNGALAARRLQVLLNPIHTVLAARRIVFVGGKGGVGKTTVAAALAVTAADRGRRTLVVSTDPAHSLGDVFDMTIGGAERRITEHLWGLEIDPDAEADTHIEQVKRQMKCLVHPRMYGEVDRQLDFARLAPGTIEAALLERMAEIMATAGAAWDLLVFDTAPTGHTLRLLSLPDIMSAWTEGLLKHQARSSSLGSMLGRLVVDTPADYEKGSRAARLNELLLDRQRKLRRARDLLLDAGTTAFLLVLNPDRLSILESRKAVALLERVHVPVAAAIVNRVLCEEASGGFLEGRRRQESVYLKEIERAFTPIPRRIVPLSAEDVHGVDSLRRLGLLIAADNADIVPPN
jgi:arsenite-transporting ATPase